MNEKTLILLTFLLLSAIFIYIGIEFYFVVLLFGIPSYFLSHLIFKYVFKKETSNSINPLLMTFFLAPFFYFFFLITAIFISEFEGFDYTFDKIKWKTDKEHRYQYVTDLIESKVLIGMTKEQMRELLGDEGNEMHNDFWRYNLGVTPGLFNVDVDYLEIIFAQGKAFSVERKIQIKS